jgi:DNA repair exonuclease SbcCD ATPase subunit
MEEKTDETETKQPAEAAANEDGAPTATPTEATADADVSVTSPESDNVVTVETPTASRPPPLSAEAVDLAEMKVKIICQEKNNMALRMELKCAELQVAAKEKIDAKKTRLVELLDAKLANVERKNQRLIDMVEQMIRDKDSHCKRLVDATRNMEELGRKLADSERIRQELRNMNNELKVMLDSVEGKGTKLAQLAKEKVIKYKELNERMQRQIDGMKNDAAAAAEIAEQQSAAATVSTAEFWSNFEATEALRGQLVERVDAATAAAAELTDAAGTGTVSINTDDVDAVGGLYPVRVAVQLASTGCAELGLSLERLRASAVELLSASAGRVGELEAQNAALRLKLQRPDAAAAATGGGEGGGVDDAERERLLKEQKQQLEAKDAEIATLSDELLRLKSAIGQLVGLSAFAPPAAAAAAPSGE